MLRLDVRGDMAPVIRTLGAQAADIPKAVSVSLNWLAVRVREAEYASMRQVFTAPTPFTLKSLFIKNATPATLEARVFFKGSLTGLAGVTPGTQQAAAHYLEPQVFGGGRPKKRSELLLANRGLMEGARFYVPGRNARLDAYGNISRGQIQQILSALQASFDPRSRRSLSRRSQRKARQAQYFALPVRVGNLPAGVYQRVGGQPKLVLLFVERAQYRKRLPFFETAERVVSTQFSEEFARTLRHMGSTSGLGRAA